PPVPLPEEPSMPERPSCKRYISIWSFFYLQFLFFLKPQSGPFEKCCAVMISPRFRYFLISTLVGVRSPDACGHSCYKTQIFKTFAVRTIERKAFRSFL